MADIDFGKITVYTGNYDFWYESSQLALRLQQDQQKKTKEKAEELKAFIARFSANASKSRQATSRKKMLDKLNIEEIKPSTRKYPFVQFKPNREAGDQLLMVRGLNKTVGDVQLLKNISFTIHKGDKVVFTAKNEQALSALFQCMAGELKADSGELAWGVTTTRAYFPKENAKYFEGNPLTLVDWLRQYSDDKSENFIRGFLGRMLFAGDESTKKTNVLSGGERVRCMLSMMMLKGANVLLFDEPTNHLDLESITSVNDSLTRFGGTVLFASHDHQFVQTVATRVIELNDQPSQRRGENNDSAQGGVTEYDMSYDEYLAKKGLND